MLDCIVGLQVKTTDGEINLTEWKNIPISLEMILLMKTLIQPKNEDQTHHLQRQLFFRPSIFTKCAKIKDSEWLLGLISLPFQPFPQF